MSRTITGKLRHFVNNEPLPNTPITFRLKTDVATEPGEAFPIGEYTLTTDANGDLPAGFALAVPPTGAWRYSCKISGNRAFDFYLEAGAAMTIDQIIALAGFAGTEPSPSFVPDAHAASHATGGSDPLTPAAIGAEVAGATAAHAALEGTEVHGMGTAALLTSTAVGEDLVTAVDVDGAREVLNLGLALGFTETLVHTTAAYVDFEIARWYMDAGGVITILTSLLTGEATLTINAHRNDFNGHYRTTISKTAFFAQAQKGDNIAVSQLRGTTNEIFTNTVGFASAGDASSMVITSVLEISLDGGTTWATVAGQEFSGFSLVRLRANVTGTIPAALGRMEVFSDLQISDLRGITTISTNIVAI